MKHDHQEEILLNQKVIMQALRLWLTGYAIEGCPKEHYKIAVQALDNRIKKTEDRINPPWTGPW